MRFSTLINLAALVFNGLSCYYAFLGVPWRRQMYGRIPETDAEWRQRQVFFAMTIVVIVATGAAVIAISRGPART